MELKKKCLLLKAELMDDDESEAAASSASRFVSVVGGNWPLYSLPGSHAA